MKRNANGFLVPDLVRTAKVGNSTITIKEVIVPANYLSPKNGKPLKLNQKLNGGTGIPKGITIHNTPDGVPSKGTNIAEQYCRATYNDNMFGALPTFYVYKNEIWQLLNEYEIGYHAGMGLTNRINSHRPGVMINGNLDTIAIECIGNSAESENSTALLTAYLCNKYKLDPLLDIYTHNYWMKLPDKIVQGASKNCPLYILPHWSTFLAAVLRYSEKPAPVPTPAPAPVPKALPFPDVKADAWYAEAITALKAAGIVNGYPDGTVKPEATATRAEIFKIAYEVLKLMQSK